LRSEEFNNASWTKANLAVSGNLTTAPDGTLTADRIIDDTAASTTHRVFSNVYSVVSGTTYSASCFVKAGTSNRVEISIRSNIEGIIGIVPTVFDLAAGTIISGSGRIEDYGNGWYRCTNTGTSTFTGSSSVFIYLYNSANQALYTGTASNTLFLWGAQLETGSVATSYIPTVAATATRNADVISKTGVSGFIGQSQGTLYAEVKATNFNSSLIHRIVTLSDGTTNNRIGITRVVLQNNRFQGLAANGGSLDVQIQQASDVANNSVVKLALAYAVNDFAFYVNGTLIGTDTSSAVPACSRIDIGNQLGADQFASGGINAVALYTTRLTNSQLQSLTTL
jgi:hypothetical protein